MVQVLKGQGSRMLGPLRETNCIRVEQDASGFEAGAVVRVLSLRLDGPLKAPAAPPGRGSGAAFHRRYPRVRPT